MGVGRDSPMTDNWQNDDALKRNWMCALMYLTFVYLGEGMDREGWCAVVHGVTKN